MKKTIISLIAMLVGMSAVNAAPSPWDGCAFQNFAFDFRTYQAMDPIEGYDYCALFPKVTGTLKGRFISCGLNADFRPSADVFADDDFRFYAAKWFDIFETRDGRIFGTERGIYDFDTGIQASVFVITGGEGKNAGVTGEFTFYPSWSKDGLVAYGRGYICPAK
jgi:hypothetical protein